MPPPQEWHRGESLYYEYMLPQKLTPRQVGERCGIPAETVRRWIRGTNGITYEQGLQLAKHFGRTAIYWSDPAGRAKRYQAIIKAQSDRRREKRMQQS